MSEDTGMQFSCPHCSQSLEAESDMAGQIIECPTCQKKITIPQPRPSKPQLTLRERPTSAKPINPPPLGTVTCKYCGAQHRADAVFCVSCGRNLKTGATLQTQMPRTSRPPASAQSVSLGNVVLVILACVGLYFGWKHFSSSGLSAGGSSSRSPVQSTPSTPQQATISGQDDDQTYGYVKVKYDKATSLEEKLQYLNEYISKYPRGKHVGELQALKEETEKQHAAVKQQQTYAATHGSIRVIRGRPDSMDDIQQGWFQVLSSKSQFDVDSALADIQRLKPSRNGNYVNVSKSFVDVGRYIHSLNLFAVASGRIDNRDLIFTDLEEGRYILYGLIEGTAWPAYTGYFQPVQVRGGITITYKYNSDSSGTGDLVRNIEADAVASIWVPFR